MRLLLLFEQAPRWVFPILGYEIDERTAQELDISLEQLIERFKNGKLVNLDEVTWSKLDNSDSWNVDADNLRKLSTRYGKDEKRIERGLENGDPVPAPIVLSGDHPYLIAGNTRLMVARIKGIIPKVLMI